MSGVQRFVGRTDLRAPTSPPAQPGQPRLDRSAAQGLKFGATKRFDPSPAAQTLPSTVPAPGYASNATAARNTYPNDRYTLQQPHVYHRAFDDVTVNSDFDVTKSDINFEPEDEDSQYRQEEMFIEEQHGYAAQVDHRVSQGLPQIKRRLHHVHSQSPLIVDPESQQSPPKPQSSGISGRFQEPQGPSQHPDLQLRSGQPSKAPTRQTAVHRKRNRSNEHLRDSYQQQRPKDDDELADTDEYELPGTRVAGNREREPSELQNHFEGSSDGVGTATPGASPTRQGKIRLPDQQQSPQVTMGDAFPAADYDDEKLKGMKYSDLKSEGWDTIPNPKPFELPVELQGSTLGNQIKYYAYKEVDDLALFFEQLSTSDWEEAGDWLIGKFGELLQQLKQKRQEKRALTEKFESEIEAREKAIRGKSELLDRKLQEMKASGEDVLKGKMV